MQTIVAFSHLIAKELLQPKFVAVDMTCGNGGDTIFLAKHAALVHAFDIQEQAIQETSKKLTSLDIKNVLLHHDSHVHVEQYVSSPINLFVYNLGYLPKGNKQITTTKKTTIDSLTIALQLLAAKGAILMVAYPGHEEGKIEAEAILLYTTLLPKDRYIVSKLSYLNQTEDAPFLILIQQR